jgi:hypothetical protein
MMRKVGLLGSWSPVLPRVLAPGGTPGDWLLRAFCPQDPPRMPRKTPPSTRGDTGGRFAADSTRSTPGTLGFSGRADVAQLVEHLHGKEGVPGSSPGVGLASESRFSKRFQGVVRVPRRVVGHRKCPTTPGQNTPGAPRNSSAGPRRTKVFQGRGRRQLARQPRPALSSIAMSVGRRR